MLPMRYARVQLQILKNTDAKECKMKPYKWLSSDRRCFVVQLKAPGMSDHAVCVDSRWKLVYDS